MSAAQKQTLGLHLAALCFKSESGGEKKLCRQLVRHIPEMSQYVQSASWKSHAAGTLAKRNQMLSLQRSGTGLPPRVNSTAILDTSAYSHSSVASAQNSHIEDLDFQNAHTVSPIVSSDLNLPPASNKKRCKRRSTKAMHSRLANP